MGTSTMLGQNMMALAEANHVRSWRAGLHREVADMDREQGFATVADLLDQCPDEIHTLPVVHLLAWIRRVGRTYATKVLERTLPGVKMSITCGALTDRQRRILAGALRDGPPFERHPDLFLRACSSNNKEKVSA